MPKMGTTPALEVTELKNPGVQELLRVADEIGCVEVMAGGKLYHLTVSPYKENPSQTKSPFAKFKPIPVTMTNRGIGDLVANMRGK